MFSLPDGYQVVLGNGGSTAFWDIATFCLIRERSQHLSFGEFSAKFASAAKAAPFLADRRIVSSTAGTRPDPYAEADVDVYAWPHNETSTGVMAPIRRVEGADDDALVLIDATSGAGGLPVDVRETDVYYFAPQKCFASDGGLWIALMSPAAVERVAAAQGERPVDPGLPRPADRDRQLRAQPDLQHAVAGHLFLLAEQTDWLNSPRRAGRCCRAHRPIRRTRSILGRQVRRRDPVRRRAVGSFAGDRHDRLRRDSVDAAAVAKVLRANGIVDTEPYRKLGRNQLRVAMFPAVDPADVAALTACIDYVITHL